MQVESQPWLACWVIMVCLWICIEVIFTLFQVHDIYESQVYSSYVNVKPIISFLITLFTLCAYSHSSFNSFEVRNARPSPTLLPSRKEVKKSKTTGSTTRCYRYDDHCWSHRWIRGLGADIHKSWYRAASSVLGKLRSRNRGGSKWTRCICLSKVWRKLESILFPKADSGNRRRH